MVGKFYTQRQARRRFRIRWKEEEKKTEEVFRKIGKKDLIEQFDESEIWVGGAVRVRFSAGPKLDEVRHHLDGSTVMSDFSFEPF